jgi:hypothetical protein
VKLRTSLREQHRRGCKGDSGYVPNNAVHFFDPQCRDSKPVQ